MNHDKIGINQLVVSVPSIGIKAEELVRAFHKRNSALSAEQLDEAIKNDIGKMTAGLGIKQIRLPGYSESNLTFVADAIYEFVKRVSASSADMEKLRREPIRTIYYASESNPDRSRPEVEVSFLLVYSKLLSEDSKYRELVEMLKGAALLPVTYACAGGGLSVIDAVSNVYLSIGNGKPQSALVITADNAIYDHTRAPNAEYTQGAGATLMWITKDPELASIIYANGSGDFHMTLSDFTKFGFETPIVHGKFSERVYVYTIAKSLEMLERNGGTIPFRELQFFVTHVPFPKQSIYFASFLFAHYLKNYDKELFQQMEKREEVGEEPTKKYGRLTALMDSKFAAFNTNGGSPKNEADIIDYIEKDEELEAYWNWLKKLRSQKEFDDFVENLHIRSALILPSEVGNSYSSSAFIAFASMIKNATALHDGKPRVGILSFYGSGALARSIPVVLTASEETVKRRLVFCMHGPTLIDHAQYSELHVELVKGAAVRTTTGVDLIDKDKRFLGSQPLSDGFHIKKRNANGTGEYVYVENGNATPVIIRY